MLLNNVRRQNGNNSENYHYASNHLRVLKSTQQTSLSSQPKRVRYLAGLEIRITAHSSNRIEHLQVINLNNVYIQHWQQGKPAALENNQVRFSILDHASSSTRELDDKAKLISREIYYPFGGTASWATRNQTDASYKTVRYSGKELDSTGLVYYGFRYNAPWLMRWLNPDPAAALDGLNLFRMVGNNPVTFVDSMGLVGTPPPIPTALTCNRCGQYHVVNNAMGQQWLAEHMITCKAPANPDPMWSNPQPRPSTSTSTGPAFFPPYSPPLGSDSPPRPSPPPSPADLGGGSVGDALDMFEGLGHVNEGGPLTGLPDEFSAFKAGYKAASRAASRLSSSASSVASSILHSLRGTQPPTPKGLATPTRPHSPERGIKRPHSSSSSSSSPAGNYPIQPAPSFPAAEPEAPVPIPMEPAHLNFEQPFTFQPMPTPPPLPTTTVVDTLLSSPLFGDLQPDLPFKCPTCGIGASSNRGLLAHQRVIHPYGNFVCELCQQDCQTPGGLRRHQLTRHPHHYH